MKRLCILFIISLCILLIEGFTFNTHTQNEQIEISNKPTVKVMVINSYNFHHPCSAPQYNGFFSYLDKFKNNFNFDIVMYDMKTKLINVTKFQMETVAKSIIKKIKEFNPDVIYTTDDNACFLVAIPMSKKYFVVSSGLNKFPKNYIEEYKLKQDKNKIIFISEYIRLDSLWNLLDQNRVFIRKAYIITEPNSNMSTTNYYMLKNYIQELQGHVDIKMYRVKNIVQLRKVLNELNNEEPGLLIPVLQRLVMENGKYVDKTMIVKEIIKYNKKHLEIAGNSIFCKFGLSLCEIPDFFLMGEMAGRLVISYLLNKYYNQKNVIKYCDVVVIPNRVTVNKKRLEQLKYLNLLNNTNLIDRIYDKIYE